MPGVTDGYLNADPRIATSKVQTFERLAAEGLPVPRWSKQAEDLKDAKSIILRQDGLSGGRNMTLWRRGEEEPKPEHRVDFYVERLSCHREFRIHVFCGNVIHRQAKFIPEGFTGIAKNWENGCRFTGEQLDRFANEGQLRDLEQLAVRALEVLSLDFGAVDVLLNKNLKPYLLEVNTAPGLRSEATYRAYEGAVKKLYGLD